ncbi:hypothetical protein VTO42DRAFT_5397 [Malbranchea cinnamomea]
MKSYQVTIIAKEPAGNHWQGSEPSFTHLPLIHRASTQACRSHRLLALTSPERSRAPTLRRTRYKYIPTPSSFPSLLFYPHPPRKKKKPPHIFEAKTSLKARVGQTRTRLNPPKKNCSVLFNNCFVLFEAKTSLKARVARSRSRLNPPFLFLSRQKPR